MIIKILIALIPIRKWRRKLRDKYKAKQNKKINKIFFCIAQKFTTFAPHLNCHKCRND